MNDLISREALRKALWKMNGLIYPVIEDVDDIIARMPAVDAEPVRHGTWGLVEVGVGTRVEAYHGCSACGCVFKSPSNYCPNCGAKMDGTEK